MLVKDKKLKVGDKVYGYTLCHAAYDGHLKTGLSMKEIEEYFYRGMRRTWLILLRDGVLK